MSNAFRVWNNWFSVSSQTAMLALEAQSVIALRLMRIAAGGALARSETTRMVMEKAQALGEAQAVAAVGSVTGRLYSFTMNCANWAAKADAVSASFNVAPAPISCR